MVRQRSKGGGKVLCLHIPELKITNVTTIHDTPSGDCDIVSFGLSGQQFMAISAGPLFKFNSPSHLWYIVIPKKKLTTTGRKLSAVPEPNSAAGSKTSMVSHGRLFHSVMEEIMKDKDEKKMARVTEAFLKMKV